MTMLFSHDEELRKYFYGPSDERTAQLQPPVPTTGVFYGPEGTVALAGGVYYPGAVGTGGDSGRIHFSRAIVGGSSLGYERINTLATRVQFLQGWMGLSAPEPEMIHDDGGRVLGVRVEATRGSTIRLASRLNLSVQQNFMAEPDPDGWWVRTPVALKTSAASPREWTEHATLHRRVCDLMSIATGSPTGVHGAWATADHDPLRTLDGRAHGLTARLVVTQEFPEPSELSYPDFLFTFADVGSAGVHRWINLHDDDFHVAMDAIRGTFRPNGMYLESQFGLAALAVERVGYALGVESGAWKRGAQPSFVAKATALAALVPELDATSWIPNLNKLYRAHKHPDHPEPDGDQMLTMLKSTKALLRAWVAVRLGAPSDEIARRLGGPTAVNPNGGQRYDYS